MLRWEKENRISSDTGLLFNRIIKPDIVYDKNEMDGYKWFTFEELRRLNHQLQDPHIVRFIRKLQTILFPK